MELAIVAQVQRIFGVYYDEEGKNQVKNKFFFAWFSLWSTMGAEYGYLIVMPFWHWNIDTHVMRHSLAVVVISMYIGQWIKSYTPWPRPYSPPVARLEKTYISESTMPSTHACLGAALPFSLLLFTSQIYSISMPWGIFLATFAFVNICLSRVYLGMHYVSDLVVGSAISFLVLKWLHPYVLLLDAIFVTHIEYAVATTVLLAAIFPTSGGSECGLRADTCRLLGVLCAAYLGAKFFYDRDMLQIPCPLPQSTKLSLKEEIFAGHRLAQCTFKFAIGLSVALAVRAISRVVLHTFLTTMISLFPSSIKKPAHVHLKRWGPYEVPFYYISYFLIAATIIIVTKYAYFYVGLTPDGHFSQYPVILNVSKEDPFSYQCVQT